MKLFKIIFFFILTSSAFAGPDDEKIMKMEILKDGNSYKMESLINVLEIIANGKYDSLNTESKDKVLDILTYFESYSIHRELYFMTDEYLEDGRINDLRDLPSVREMIDKFKNENLGNKIKQFAFLPGVLLPLIEKSLLVVKDNELIFRLKEVVSTYVDRIIYDNPGSEVVLNTLSRIAEEARACKELILARQQRATKLLKNSELIEEVYVNYKKIKNQLKINELIDLNVKLESLKSDYNEINATLPSLFTELKNEITQQIEKLNTTKSDQTVEAISTFNIDAFQSIPSFIEKLESTDYTTLGKAEQLLNDYAHKSILSNLEKEDVEKIITDLSIGGEYKTIDKIKTQAWYINNFEISSKVSKILNFSKTNHSFFIKKADVLICNINNKLNLYEIEALFNALNKVSKTSKEASIPNNILVSLAVRAEYEVKAETNTTKEGNKKITQNKVDYFRDRTNEILKEMGKKIQRVYLKKHLV